MSPHVGRRRYFHRSDSAVHIGKPRGQGKPTTFTDRAEEPNYDFLKKSLTDAKTETAFDMAYRELQSRQHLLSEEQRKRLVTLGIKRANNIGGKKLVFKIFGKGVEVEKEGDLV
jgi:hypothetical protein